MMLWGNFSEITFPPLNDRSRIQMCTQVLSSNGNSRRLKIKEYFSISTTFPDT